MNRFENVTISKSANVYFNGNVTSRMLKFDDGSIKTLGIMQPGEYEFGTEAAELMEITVGKLDVMLPGTTQWSTITDGESFNVAANSKFQVKVYELTDYCCSYFD